MTGRIALLRRDAVGIGCFVSLCAVLALWLSGPGAHDLAPAPAPLLVAAGRLAGLVSADLLLVQVLLMARVPAIVRAAGPGQIAGRHRRLGLWSMGLLAAHLAATTVGYAIALRSGVPAQIWLLVRTYPGMPLAAAGTAALVLVAVTSARVVRRRLRYASWHLLHLYAYLGIALALPHQLWTGGDLLASPAARVYWWGAYGLVAGALLVFRVGVPVARALRGAQVRRVLRTAVTLAATGMSVALLFLYPPSLNRGSSAAATDRDLSDPALSDPAGPDHTGMDMGADEDTPSAVQVVDGKAVDTGFGPVQVRIHVYEGSVVHADAVVFPHDSPASRVVSDNALPLLAQEVLRRQASTIDTVSGATETSEGYRMSLQSALDAAHL